MTIDDRWDWERTGKNNVAELWIMVYDQHGHNLYLVDFDYFGPQKHTCFSLEMFFPLEDGLSKLILTLEFILF